MLINIYNLFQLQQLLSKGGEQWIVLSGPYESDSVLRSIAQVCSHDKVFKDQGLCQLNLSDSTKIILEFQTENDVNDLILQR